MSNERDLKHLSAQIEELAHRVEGIADPIVRSNVVVLLQSLLELHGQAFRRVMELIVREKQTGGSRIIENCAGDELISGLLLLYECHPHSLEVRVARAIQKIGDHFSSSGRVELLGMRDRTVRLRVTSDESCSSLIGANQFIENLVFAEAPELSSVEVERVHKAGDRSELVQFPANAAASRA